MKKWILGLGLAVSLAVCAETVFAEECYEGTNIIRYESIAAGVEGTAAVTEDQIELNSYEKTDYYSYLYPSENVNEEKNPDYVKHVAAYKEYLDSNFAKKWYGKDGRTLVDDEADAGSDFGPITAVYIDGANSVQLNEGYRSESDDLFSGNAKGWNVASVMIRVDDERLDSDYVPESYTNQYIASAKEALEDDEIRNAIEYLFQAIEENKGEANPELDELKESLKDYFYEDTDFPKVEYGDVFIKVDEWPEPETEKTDDGYICRYPFTKEMVDANDEITWADSSYVRWMSPYFESSYIDSEGRFSENGGSSSIVMDAPKSITLAWELATAPNENGGWSITGDQTLIVTIDMNDERTNGDGATPGTGSDTENSQEEEADAADPAADGSQPDSNQVYTDANTILQVQDKLNQAGFDCGTADGVAGNKTRQAIRAYREANGLNVTEEIDDELLASLGL